MDYSDLRGDARKHFPTQAAFAKALGISECALSKKLNGHTQWTGAEMARACQLLGKSPEAIPKYFFTPVVEKSQ